MHFIRTLATLLALCAASAGAAPESEFWPGTRYDAAIPSFENVLGHAPGERIVSYRDIIDYMGALAEAAPEQLRLEVFAESWEGRELVYAAIGSKENMARLDEIGASMRRLADPRTLPKEEAESFIASLPVGVWLSYGVHGNEISSPDAGLLTAYHLLAARGSAIVEEILEHTIVFIVPTQNPDGRNRFVHNFEVAEGLEADADPLAAEHNEPWPGGRTNHYHFDMNRDWFALTQPEIRGQAAAMQQWYPLVVVDLHEMGGNSTYYFAPAAEPYNPHLTLEQKAGMEMVGRNNAHWFDEFGFDYFTREVYDAQYPGYGDSWPAFYGAVAMTYEQASARGLVTRRDDGTDLHFRDGVRHHFVASVSTAQAAARNREKLLRDFYEYRKSAIEEGEKAEVKEYIFPLRGDVSATVKLAGLLAAQGVEVKRATEPFKSGGETYETGTYVVSANQPAHRLVRNLLDVDVAMDGPFLEEQERRRAKNLPDEIYDVTAWSLPLLYNVDCVRSSSKIRGWFEFVLPWEGAAGSLEGATPAKVAYLVPWGSQAAGRLLAAALREGLQVWSSDKTFRQGVKEYPRGTLIFKVKENPDNVADTLGRLADESGAQVFAVSDSWIDEGVNFGSENVVKLKRPHVAIAWDAPTSASSAGSARFVLERQFGYPVTVVRARSLSRADLSSFDVLILPSGNYAQTLGAGGGKRLKAWVERGGTLIAIGGAVSYLTSEDVGLLSIKQENNARGTDDAPSKKGKNGDDEDSNRVDGSLIENAEDFEKAIQAEEELPDAVSGVLLKAESDRDHWLTAGVAESLYVLVQGRAIFSPVTLDNGVNAVRYAGPDEVLASGYLWEENRKQLAYKPFVVVEPHARGLVVAFTADPNFRAYMDGLNVLFLNAVFRGPAHASPAY